MIPLAFPIVETERNPSPRQRRRANRFALMLFTLTALAGLAIKYLL
jgi:hypothetical protein